MIVVLGVLTILAGILPFLGNLGVAPNIITVQPGYQFVIIAIGILGLIYGLLNSLLFGLEKIVTITIGILTILGGIIPFLQNFMPVFLPTAGIFYSGIIIAIGAVGIVYGFMALG
jgi:hypothetical protein